MKRLILILFGFFVLLWVPSVNGENMFDGDGSHNTDYVFEFGTGGNDDCLDSVDGNNLTGNEVAQVFRDIGGYRTQCVYWFNFGTSTTESDPLYIRPDNNPTGTWELSNAPSNIGTVQPTSPFTGHDFTDTTP